MDPQPQRGHPLVPGGGRRPCARLRPCDGRCRSPTFLSAFLTRTTGYSPSPASMRRDTKRRLQPDRGRRVVATIAMCAFVDASRNRTSTPSAPRVIRCSIDRPSRRRTAIPDLFRGLRGGLRSPNYRLDNDPVSAPAMRISPDGAIGFRLVSEFQSGPGFRDVPVSVRLSDVRDRRRRCSICAVHRLAHASIDAMSGKRINFGYVGDPPPGWTAHLSVERPDLTTGRRIHLGQRT